MESTAQFSLIQFALSKIHEAVCLIDAEGRIIQRNPVFDGLIAPNGSVTQDSIQAYHLINTHGHVVNWTEFFDKVRQAGQLSQRLGVSREAASRFFQFDAYYFQQGTAECICLIVRQRTPEEYADEVDEAHLYRVMDNFPLLLCGWDQLGRFSFWNKECERVLGHAKSEMLANPDGMALLYPDAEERKKIMERWNDCQHTYHRIRDWELEVTCHNQTKRTISWTIQYEGEPFMGLYTWGIGMDITEKMQARKALETSEKRFATISKATNDAVWEWNLQTNELVWNDGITYLFGHPNDQIERNILWWEKNIHPEDQDRVVKRIYEFVERGEEFWWDEYRFGRQDGSYAFVYDKGHILKDSSGKPIRMIGGILDITDRKIFEQNLEIKNHQLAEYVFHNSHKVRAPLARLLGLAYLLNDQHPDISESKEMIEKIKTAADEIDRMTRHVSNIMI